MKKIPTIFERDFTQGGKITREWHPEALRLRIDKGEGVATYKWDGTAVKILDGAYFKRYDAKRGKTPPAGFVPCGPPDEQTGHHPGWIPVDPAAPENKWHMDAFIRSNVFNGTYELVGPKIQGNPHQLAQHELKRHGEPVVRHFPRQFDLMGAWFLENGPLEGVVFWIDGEPVAKIKSRDFGLLWNC
jgi:hypothetical protein